MNSAPGRLPEKNRPKQLNVSGGVMVSVRYGAGTC